MGRLVLLVLVCCCLVPNAQAAERSWAQPQIEAVVEAGPARRLRRHVQAAEAADAAGARRRARDALARVARSPSPTAIRSSFPAARSRSASSTPRSSASSASATPPARVTAALRDAGLAPKAGAGTETVARLLGLRFNHPAAEDTLELGLNDPATRAEAAYSLARLLDLSGWEQEQIASLTEQLVLPEVTGTQQQLLRRAVSFVGWPYIWGGTSEAAQQLWNGKQLPGGFDCSGFVWRVFKLEPFAGASALATVLRGRTTFEMSGEVPPAQRIKKVENLQPGDLIFQGAKGPKSKPAQVDHAGIYLGGGWFVHSSGNGTTLHPFEGWYRDRFAWARRPLREAGSLAG